MSENTKLDSVSFKRYTTLVVPSRVSTGLGMEVPVKVVVRRLSKREDRSLVVEVPEGDGIPSLKTTNRARFSTLIHK